VAPESIRIEFAGSNGRPRSRPTGTVLRQVLASLLENAVKYSPDGGVVELRIDCKETGVRFSVRDEGLGIPSSEHDWIVRRLGGRISFSSETGRGSTFFVDLPVGPLPATGGKTSDVRGATAV
jgi:two-component system sensor histidine kinase TctE